MVGTEELRQGEDDFARYHGHGTPTPPPLLSDDRGHGRPRDLAEEAAPSLCTGAIAAQGPVLERLRATRHVDDFFVSCPRHEAALELLSSPV